MDCHWGFPKVGQRWGLAKVEQRHLGLSNFQLATPMDCHWGFPKVGQRHLGCDWGTRMAIPSETLTETWKGQDCLLWASMSESGEVAV
eukprot:scaffold36484_cov229-Amphora_coffeaeformis.AAC.1